MKLVFRLIHDDAILPTRKFESDAGWDLYSIDTVVIPAYDQRIIHTGIELSRIERNWDYLNVVLQIWPRSGLDSSKGLHTGAGIVDIGYRGEILVLLKNTTDKDQMIEVGDKIAQLVPVFIPHVEVHEEVTEIPSNDEFDRGKVGGIYDVSRNRI